MDKMEEFKKYMILYFYKEPNIITEFLIKYNLAYPYEYASLFLVHRLCEFSKIFNSHYFNQEVVSNFNLALENDEFDSAYEILVHEWKHAYLPLTISLDILPKEINRKIMVPIRNSLADSIYAILAAFRCSGQGLVNLNIMNYTFITLAEENTSGSYLADEFSLCILALANKSRLTYDYSLDYEFSIKPRKVKYVYNDKCYDDVILEGGNGYGIIDDDKQMIIDYYNGTLADDSEIPYNFKELNTKSFSKYINEEFEKIKIKYDSTFLTKYYNMVKELEDEGDSNLVS